MPPDLYIDWTHIRHPSEPQCSYDPVEGLPIAPEVDPIERMRLLEEQICELCSPTC